MGSARGNAIPLVVMLVLVCKDAHAYLDPATGSIILQAVIAFVAGTIVLMHSYGRKIKGFFVRGQSKTGTVNEPEPSDSERSKGE